MPLPSVLSSLRASAVARAAALVVVEAGVLVVLAVVYAVGGLTSDPESVAGAEVGAALLAVGAALLLLVARGLVRRHPRAFAPAVAVQLLTALTGLSLLQTLPVAAVAAVVLAAVVLYQLLTPEARRDFGPRDRG